MRRKLRLIATDLDGTITGDNRELSLYTDLRKRFDHLRARDKAIWVVCTGRSLKSFLKSSEDMRTIGLFPDYVIIKHAYVYERRQRRYWPHTGWNLRIRLHLLNSKIDVSGILQEWADLVLGITPFVTTIHNQRDRLCLRFDKDEDCSKAYAILEEKARHLRHLTVFRYLLEIDIRMVPFTKGLALQDLAQRLDIERDEILTIGNGHNDISMLDGRVAAHTGCPGNSRATVMQTVAEAGGHISRKHFLSGTLDVIDAYLEDRIDSSLPEWWQQTAETHNPRTRGWMPKAPHQSSHEKRHHHGIFILLAVVYVLLTVFASYDMIPFSRVFMYPFILLGRILENVL